MGEFSFRKLKKYKDKSFIEIRYEGKLTEVSNVKEAEKLIEEFLDKGTLHSDMRRNVSYIRTLLDTFIEESLTIEYYNNFGTNYELVNYENRVLYFYRCQKCSENVELKANFIFGQLETKFCDKSCGFIENTNIEKTKELSNSLLEQIAFLNKAREVFLDNESKAIITAYRLFYKENPNFSSKSINLKIQAMVLILKQFNMFSEYQFSIQDEVVECYRLKEMINKLFSLGEVTAVKNPIEFKESLKVIIIGDTIREKVGNEIELNEVLLSISKTIYASNFDIPFLSDIKEIAGNTNLGLTYNEVSDSIKLVNTIQEKIRISNRV